MNIIADLFNATLAYNPFNALFSDSTSTFTSSETTSMLQSGLFMSFISLCHYWEVNGISFRNQMFSELVLFWHYSSCKVWNIIHFSFVSLTYIHMLLLILQGPFPAIAPYHLYVFQPLCLLWGIYYLISVSREEKNKKRRRRRRQNRSSTNTKSEFTYFRNIGMQTN